VAIALACEVIALASRETVLACEVTAPDSRETALIYGVILLRSDYQTEPINLTYPTGLKMTKEQTFINESVNLDELLDRFQEIRTFEYLCSKIHGRIDDPVSWDDLPTFGGDRPTGVLIGQILSWDNTRMLVSMGNKSHPLGNDLVIVDRPQPYNGETA